MRQDRRAESLFGAALLLSLAAIGAALVSQHVFQMRPCPWCVLQRLIFMVVGAAAALGLLWRQALSQRTFAALAFLLAVAGMAAAVWHNRVAAATASCDRTLADRIVAGTGLDTLWPQLFMATASCAEAPAALLGVPYEIYSLGLFALQAVLMLRVLRLAA